MIMYEVISDVTIRREPRVVEYKDTTNGKFVTNAVGKLTVGTQREVYSVTVDKDNAMWGRISESDALGISQWVCIKNINRTFMKLLAEDIDTSLDMRLIAIERKIAHIIEWIQKQDKNFSG